MDLPTLVKHDEITPKTDRSTGRAEDLLPLLQKYQNEFGYIPQEAVSAIAKALKVSENRIYGVASFYTQFRFQKPGEKCIRVCLGTACHVQGGEKLSRELQAKLGVRPGETSADGRYEYHEVACLGCCAQAAVVEVEGKIYGKMTADQIGKVLDEDEEL